MTLSLGAPPLSRGTKRYPDGRPLPTAESERRPTTVQPEGARGDLGAAVGEQRRASVRPPTRPGERGLLRRRHSSAFFEDLSKQAVGQLRRPDRHDSDPRKEKNSPEEISHVALWCRAPLMDRRRPASSPSISNHHTSRTSLIALRWTYIHPA
eukprot:CAMPEP_0118900322 /NCGR_PEP_ID=MMETSP1166-20130328/6486_1 /TAXON_ID=1104430 /ORGANISM="Chrysoreinhardia sp, Strain CCMP3193" /LENGTH=152 /DNA_ID=CAMNT_0006839461 /DNA_START=167 /DNA_END=621 /DNA_ORIENTATION=-